MCKIGIVGGGASGIMAAIAAAESGACVTIFERKESCGKKILVTGNGRCNFSNSILSSQNYYCDDTAFVDSIFSRFGNTDLCMFFNSLGMLVKDKNGYLYPACEQASTVLDVLESALKERSVVKQTDAYVTSITSHEGGYKLTTENGKDYIFDKVIISTGGRSGIGKEYANGYDLIKKLGHTYTRLYPALTQIKCKDFDFGAVSGVRGDCAVTVNVGGQELMKQGGELLFTDTGISGIVSFQISHCVAELLDKKNVPTIKLDFFPANSEDEINKFAAAKYLVHDNQTIGEFFNGFLNRKLNIAIIKAAGFDCDRKISELSLGDIYSIISLMKNLEITPSGVNGFDKSQVTGGGVPLSELTSECESLKNKGLFITGELLNVDGICGGYNLQWAFSTGYIAGKAAAQK